MKRLALKLVLVFVVLMLLTASIGMAYPQQQGGDRHSGGHGGHQQQQWHSGNHQSHYSWGPWGGWWPWGQWGQWGRLAA